MAQRFVFTELGQGLRRNLSMHIAVILTLLVSLTLVGVGVLLHYEAGLTQKRFGSELQIRLNLCNGAKTNPQGCDGAVTAAQKSTIEDTLDKLKSSGLISAYDFQTQQQEYDSLKQYGLGPVSKSATAGSHPLITAKDMWSSYLITLGDAHKGDEVAEAIQHLQGVAFLQDNRSFVTKILDTIDRLQRFGIIAAVALVIAALLLVSNTIQLAAIARRREIAIMRLVGASTLYIALPFLLEGLVVAVIGAALSIGALAGVMWFGVVHGLSGLSWDEWVGWPQYVSAALWMAGLGIVLTLAPTLLLTRKYVKV